MEQKKCININSKYRKIVEIVNRVYDLHQFLPYTLIQRIGGMEKHKHKIEHACKKCLNNEQKTRRRSRKENRTEKKIISFKHYRSRLNIFLCPFSLLNLLKQETSFVGYFFRNRATLKKYSFFFSFCTTQQ